MTLEEREDAFQREKTEFGALHPNAQVGIHPVLLNMARLVEAAQAYVDWHEHKARLGDPVTPTWKRLKAALALPAEPVDGPRAAEEIHRFAVENTDPAFYSADNPDPLAELAYDPDASRFAAEKVAAAYTAYGPDMDFDEVTENIETGWGRREHVTDGSPCWCDPIILGIEAEGAPSVLEVLLLAKAIDACWAQLLAPLGGQADGMRRSAECIAAEYERLRAAKP